MPSVAWSRGRNIHDNEPELKRSDSFGAFAAELDHDRAARKEGAAYFCGPFNHDGKRSKDNVEATRFLVFDIDGCPPDVLPDLRMWFAQYEGIGWPTHSSTAAEPHERAVMHLVRAVSREEALQLGQAISRYLADSFPGLNIDPATFKPEQPVFMPPAGQQLAQYRGEPIEVDSWLALVVAQPQSLPTPSTPAGQRIPAGRRDATMASMAGSMRRRGMSPTAILAALRVENERCDPAMLERDLERIAKSVGRYEPAPDKVEEASESAQFSGKWPVELEPHLSGLYLVKGLLPTRAVVQVYGEPNCGKSAVVVDLCCHLACNRPYHGGRIRAAHVAYLALENPVSMENRVVAWCRHNDVPRAELRLFVVRGNLSLLNAVSVETVIEFLQKAQAQAKVRFELIVLDTQARATPGANENASEDMSRLITHVDRLRDVLEATVLLVHHAGKDATKGARGHSSQLGAVDTAIEVTDRQMILRKGRDMVSGRSLSFALTPVDLGNDEDGDPVTAVVASLLTEAPQSALPKRAKFTGMAGIALAALNRLIVSGKSRTAPAGHSCMPPGVPYVSIDEWTDTFKSAVDSKDSAYLRKAFFDAKATLLKAGAIGIHDNPRTDTRIVWRNRLEPVDNSGDVGD